MYRQSVVAVCVLVCVLGAFLLWSLRTSYLLHEYDTNDDLLNHTLNLERQLEARFQLCDLVLHAAVQEFRHSRGTDPQRGSVFSAKLRQLASLLPSGPQVRGADQDGHVIYGQGLDPANPLSVAQRRFFVDARATEGPVIGLPLKSRVTNTWVVPMARQLQDEQGEFAGVVYANIELEELSNSLKGLRLGPRGAASIFNARGEVLVRSVDEPDRTDEGPVRLTAPVTRDAITNGLEARSFEATSPIDGIRRVVMFRAVGPYPLYVGVGLERREAFETWYAEARAAAFIWLALTASAALFVIRQRKASRLLSTTVEALHEARLRADQASEFKSAWLANMSHEIRTPMNGVLGFAQLGHRLPNVLPEAKRLFERIVEAGRLLQAILDDVLDMSKIEAGKLLLHAEPTAVRNVARRAVDLVSEAAHRKRISVRCWVADDVPAIVSVDGVRLQQVLLNLLSNAVKFTDVGRVELAVEIDAASLKCTVKDSGSGMSDDQMRRLFMPFEQGDASITRRHGGTGLGLAITKRLVLLMGGSIEGTSELRVGSKFVIRLPVTESLPAWTVGADAMVSPPRTHEDSLDPARLQGLHLLVVEDNEVNQLVIHGMLQAEGSTVEVASNGYDAVQRVKASGKPPFDAVLLDIMMPGIDGYETARRIHSLHPALPIIGQTAHAMPEELARCQAAGMLDRVVKPIVVDELVRSLRRHVPERQTG